MAEVIAKFNTKTKELTVNMDGKDISNVMSVRLDKSYGGSDDSENQEYGCSILTLDKLKDDGYQTYTQIVASDTKDGKALKEDGASASTVSNEFVEKKGESLTQILMRKVFNRKK